MNPIITMRGVGKSFGRHHVLRGADLEVGKGEVVGLLGPNGAGKSTCLRMLVGLVFRDSGIVQVHGFDPATDSLAIRRRTAYLPGETAVYSGMTGAEFLDFALGFYERRHVDLEEQLLADFALPLRQSVRTYSAGMKQKLALLAVLVPDVDLYVLDEPDRALDAQSRLVLSERLRELATRGRTIVLTSHHLSDIEAIAQRIVFMIDGRNVPEENVQRLRVTLRKELRLRVKAGTPLPPGLESVHENPDGSLRIRTAGDPLAWARSIAPERIESLEVGATRLEALFDALSREAAP